MTSKEEVQIQEGIVDLVLAVGIERFASSASGRREFRSGVLTRGVTIVCLDSPGRAAWIVHGCQLMAIEFLEDLANVPDMDVCFLLCDERLLMLPAVGDTVTMSFPAHACWVMR